MKKVLYILIVSLLFQTNISYSMERNIVVNDTNTPEFFLHITMGSILAIIMGALIYKNIFKTFTKKNQNNTQLTPQELAEEAKKISYQKNINMPDLHHACELGEIESVKKLITEENINKIHSYKIDYSSTAAQISSYQEFADTPLHIACRKQHSDVLYFLLSYPSIDLNSLDLQENTPLIAAYLYALYHAQDHKNPHQSNFSTKTSF